MTLGLLLPSWAVGRLPYVPLPARSMCEAMPRLVLSLSPPSFSGTPSVEMAQLARLTTLPNGRLAKKRSMDFSSFVA